MGGGGRGPESRLGRLIGVCRVAFPASPRDNINRLPRAPPLPSFPPHPSTANPKDAFTKEEQEMLQSLNATSIGREAFARVSEGTFGRVTGGRGVRVSSLGWAQV